MAIKIEFDSTHNVISPTVILANRNGNKIGEIIAHSVVLKDCMSNASEMTFDVYKELDGEKCELWDKIKDFKLVWCKEWDTWFEIKVEISDIDEEIKKIVYCTKLGNAELSQIKLYGIEINTEIDIDREDYKEPTVFYNEEYPEISLLDRIMEKAPHYKLKHVDYTLKDIQRTFSFDDISINDVHSEIAEEVGCLFVYDSNSDENGNIARDISVYDLHSNCIDCGHRGEFTEVCPECGSTNITEGYGKDTTIFVSSDALASEIKFTTDTDSVKNCFKLEGGDDLFNATIRNCNSNGTDYIWHISDDVKEDMSVKLKEKLNTYDELYKECQENREIILDESLLESYNDIVDKYIKYNDELENIYSPIIGYLNLMKAYYNTIDLSSYLQSSLMPNVEMIETNTAEQTKLLTPSNLSPVAITNISSISLSVTNNAVLSMAKLIINPNFKVEIDSSSLSGITWTGVFKVTNYSDEDDYAYSNRINIEITDDMETYLKQKIEKILNDNVDDLSISGLFEKDLEDFKNELKKYCLDSLNILYNSCQAALNILIEQGVSDVSDEAWDNSEISDLYTNLYKPYYVKLSAIENEIKVRENEINSITGVYNTYGDLTEYGLQNYIIDEKNSIQKELSFEDYIGRELWIEFCSYRREEKYSNSNYITDGLNNAEIFDKVLEFIKVASNEIYKSAERQHSITSTLNNLLVMKEFEVLLNHFEIGNWIRIRVDDTVYKLRLLEYEIDFDNLENINVVFSDVIKVANGITDVKSILEKANSMASSYDTVMHQASQGSSGNKRVNNWVNKGLDLTNMKIISGSDNQEIEWNQYGFIMKEYLPITDTFSDKQLKIINKGLYVTDDNWKTSKAGIGNFMYYDPKDGQTKESYGVIADTLIGNLILGENVGIYNKSNSLIIDEHGFVLSNENVSGVTNPVTITMNPNSNNGTFIIKNEQGNLIRVTKDGELVVGNNNFVIDANGNGLFSGAINVGSGKFIVDTEGNVEMNGSIVLGGDITWKNDPFETLNQSIKYAEKTANSAKNTANSANSIANTANNNANNALDDILDLVNGRLAKSGASFITNKNIYSPYMLGGQFIVVDYDAAPTEEKAETQLRTVINKDGIRGFNENGQLHGFVTHPNFELNTDDGFSYYSRGNEMFKVARYFNDLVLSLNTATGENTGQIRAQNNDKITIFEGKWGFAGSSSIDFSNTTVKGLKVTFG